MKVMAGLMMVAMVAMVASFASADLVQNPSFDDGSTNWSYSSAWGNYFYPDGPDTITSMGGWGNNVDWSNTSLWQNTGNTFAADTVYSLSATWRDGDPTPVDNIRLTVQDVTAGWTIVASDIFTVHDGANWYTSTLEFDTASNPAVVGHTIGVGLDLTSGTGTWVHVDEISMIPEPATIGLIGFFGVGMLFVRRRLSI